MKLHSVLYEIYILHIVFSVPSLLVNELLNVCAYHTKSKLFSIKSRHEINTFCENINFGSSSIFSYNLHFRQSVPLHLFLLLCSVIFSHLLSLRFNVPWMTKMAIWLFFLPQCTIWGPKIFAFLNIWTGMCVCVSVCLCLCVCWMVPQFWIMKKGSRPNKAFDR